MFHQYQAYQVSQVHQSSRARLADPGYHACLVDRQGLFHLANRRDPVHHVIPGLHRVLALHGGLLDPVHPEDRAHLNK